MKKDDNEDVAQTLSSKGKVTVAKEKAGILKEGSIAVIEDTSPAPLAAIEPRVRELDGDALVDGHEYSLMSPARVAVAVQAPVPLETCSVVAGVPVKLHAPPETL